MASIVLSAAGSAIGRAVAGPLGSFLGGKIGQAVGGIVSQRLMAGNVKISGRSGARLQDLSVQTSTYGRMVPIVYGTARIAGNIIWAQPIKEVATTTRSSSGGGKGGGKVTQTSTSYSYYANLAIAICEGQVTDVLRVWADAKQLDLSRGTFRIYKGSEDQQPDSFIQAAEGADNTPAYRGMAYVVMEDFPLADYGNRIPNFTFEVSRKAQSSDYNGRVLEDEVTSMILIPGAGEFVYDTQVQNKIPGEQVGASWVQRGQQEPINMHNAGGQANVILALDQLKSTCPNVEWVSVVVSWFGSSLDIATCDIKPGVEYQQGAATSPDTWAVAGFNRSTARLITQVNGSPQYGGTPDDGSIVALLTELRARGYKVALYPMIFIDTAGKPWRGNLTGSSGQVSSFFSKQYGYNNFINHYVSLCSGLVDGFIIGSEMKGLTSVTSSAGVFPAVSEFVSLAASVKTALGSQVKVTYAADWSEYHHADGGWYNLDPLWASANIDVIGIDAYFPLTDQPQSGYTVAPLISGWTSGEGYDWYYSDVARTTQASLAPAYAWKNLQWFWENTHTNPNAVQTSWVPQSKPVWLTEIGYPSVDGAANQPNVFYDPSSSQSAFPYHSKGRVDFRAQRAALMAAHEKWRGSGMVQRQFVWTWDARPYPYWPDLTQVWADGVAWKTGHWVQGKLGITSLAAIIKDICLRCGLSAGEIDVSQLSEQVEGYVIAGQQSGRDSIAQLEQGYFFDAVEAASSLTFMPKSLTVALSISESDLAVGEDDQDKGHAFHMQRMQEVELPKRINVTYFNRTAGYLPATQYAQREHTQARDNEVVELPLVLSDQNARIIADILLYQSWVGRVSYSFSLPLKFCAIEPADLLDVTVRGVQHRMRVHSVRLGEEGVLKLEAVAEDISTYDFYSSHADSGIRLAPNIPVPQSQLALLDIPALPGDDSTTPNLRVAMAGLAGGWSGSELLRSDDGGVSYQAIAHADAEAALGTTIDVLPAADSCVFDEISGVTVVLAGGAELQGATELAVLNGANLALVGNELVQFKSATLLAPSKYKLGGLLRGRFGTEDAISAHNAAERFVLINAAVERVVTPSGLINLPRYYKGVSFGLDADSTAAQSFTYSARCLRPLSPVSAAIARDGSGNIAISWIRRTRTGGEWLDGSDVPVSEASEAYEVDIMNGSNVVRTLGGLTSASASYSSANQITDFGSNQSSVTVKIYQLSAIVGRGIAATFTG